MSTGAATPTRPRTTAPTHATAFATGLAASQVAAHNQDNREHDIFDSDDYLQFHGGMIATIRALTGRQPRHYFGDSHDPGRPAVRDLKEEACACSVAAWSIRSGWPHSRHGYKGGLELAATVDYLFGYDATAGVVDDWMYERLAESYALDPTMKAFLERSNPWGLQAIAERLIEAAERGLVGPRAEDARRPQGNATGDGDRARSTVRASRHAQTR